MRNQVRLIAALLAAVAAAAVFPLAVSAAVATSTICLSSSSGAPLAGAATQYYKDGWKPFGTTGADGCASGTALTGNLPVGITFGGVYNQHNHDFTASPRDDFRTVSATARLVDSAGAGIAGGSVQYYANGWHQLGTTDGSGSLVTEVLPGATPWGMTAGGIYNQQTQDPATTPVVTFQTVRTTVKLIDSSGGGISGGSAQYYANGWHQIGTTDATGAVVVELLPGATPFGMTAGGIYNQQTQDPATTLVVTFQTVRTTVKLVDSTGAGTSGGSAQYYANGWHQFGTTDATGAVVVELLPGATPFGMTAGGIYNQQTQDPASTPVVTFQTVRTTVKLIDSTGAGILGGSAQYYANGWHQLGATDATGAAVVELLPGETPFGMTAGGIYNQQSQDPSTTPVVTFQTVRTAVKLIDSAGAATSGGSAQYYANGWHQLGTTDASGAVVVELLPGPTLFGMTAGGVYNQKSQDPSSSATVTFQTVLVTINVVGSNGGAVSGASTNYYANGWHAIGTTGASGTTTVQLLPDNTPFNATLGSASAQVSQSTGSNALVTIKLAVAGAAAPGVQASITFVSATDTDVTWRIWPASPANLYFWDAVEGCTGQGGADCGAITSGGAGHTTAGPVASSAVSASGQGFLVTQHYAKDGDACHVTNTVTYGPASDGTDTQTASGTYQCAGTPALGWPLLGVFFLIGVAGAGMVAHKLAAARSRALS